MPNGKHKIKWLDQGISIDGPCLTLCLNEEEYLAVFEKLEVKKGIGEWCGSVARTHSWNDSNCGMVCIVCLNPEYENSTKAEIVGIIAHEAVHVWQWYAYTIGEENPGREQEAYAIQRITKTLYEEYLKRKKKIKNRRKEADNAKA